MLDQMEMIIVEMARASAHSARFNAPSTTKANTPTAPPGRSRMQRPQTRIAEPDTLYWPEWLKEQREKYCSSMRDHVFRQRVQITDRVGPAVTEELPEIKVTPPPLTVAPLHAVVGR